jgi:cytochrome bd-type quinol oxidase subunit 2
MMKILVALAFIAIIASLGSALFFMMRGRGDDKQRGDHMARALALRVGFSVLLFICLLVAWKLGWIQPTGIPLSK